MGILYNFSPNVLYGIYRSFVSPWNSECTIFYHVTVAQIIWYLYLIMLHIEYLKITCAKFFVQKTLRKRRFPFCKIYLAQGAPGPLGPKMPKISEFPFSMLIFMQNLLILDTSDGKSITQQTFLVSLVWGSAQITTWKSCAL